MFFCFLFFLAYIFVHIDDKKPYKPFNQLDTSLRPTALLIVSENKDIFSLENLLSLGGESRIIYFDYETHYLKVDRTIIGTMIGWSVKPYYTLRPSSLKKNLNYLPFAILGSYVYFNSKSVRSQSDPWFSSLFDVCVWIGKEKEKKKKHTQYNLFYVSQII